MNLNKKLRLKEAKKLRSFNGLILALLMLVSPVGFAHNQILDPIITMYVGESKVIEAANIQRLSVGASDMVSSTLLQNGEVVLIAEKAGETNMQFWFADGHRETMTVVVVEKNGWREAVEVKELLKNIPGISVKTIGRRIVVDGNLDTRDLARVNTVKERYDDIMVLAREITEYEQKMIYFDVQVTEINRDVTEELGINWSKTFAGPTLGYEKAWIHKNLAGFETGADENAFVSDGVFGEEYVFWGVSTSIASAVNMLEQTGAAITLAKPRLSARSGGIAALTVGGEVPVVTSSVSGQSVTYKDYGIILNIEPSLDMYNNIMARASVSVSQLDLSNAVDGQPAFKKRFTENDIRLSPGETLALSGLITREEQVAYSGLKWLSSIPVLGNLFKSKSFTSGETELVILITPKVIEDLARGENLEAVNRAAELVDEFNNKVDSLME